MATNGNFVPQDQYTANPASIDPATSSGASNDLSKDEVGWYFVEQYYTTLSKSPEKLHLFYGKRSQFVSGVEAEVANVSVGRQAIQERIKDLEFQESKVRISNVDSQASNESIVIQVIGEISSKAGEPKKFVQTFVLAQQPSGYFVLNDILRYIDEDGEETTEDAPVEAAAEEEAPAAAEPEPVAEAPQNKSAELKPEVVDEKLEEAATDATPNGEVPAAVDSAAAAQAAAAPDAEAVAQQVAEETAKEVERPKDPSPTPAAKAEAAKAAEEPAAPAEPAGPPKPMTWASRAAAAAGPRPVVPLPKTATPPAQGQATKAPAQPAAQPAAAPATEATPAAAPASAEAPAKDTAGWQTAGADSKRQGRPQSVSAAPEKEGTLGYVKYVTDKVQEADLKKALEAHGEMAYFDINREKNCAFVEYKTPEGFSAALSSNPHVINGEQVIVEQRRPKAAYGGNGYGRGGAQRGRGGFSGNRAGGQGRGNFSQGGRGRGGAPRGRGGAQATNA